MHREKQSRMGWDARFDGLGTPTCLRGDSGSGVAADCLTCPLSHTGACCGLFVEPGWRPTLTPLEQELGGLPRAPEE